MKKPTPESKASLKLKAAAALKVKRQAAADAAEALRVEHEEAAEQHERAAQAAEQLRIHMAEEAKAAAAFERELANQEHFAEMHSSPEIVPAKPSWWQRFTNWLSNGD